MNENFTQHPKDGDPWDVAIIGSGPASFTAAIYTTRGAASTLILGGTRWGGQLMLTLQVDNYPGFPQGVLGPDLMEKMKTQAERFGTKFIPQDVTEVDFSLPADATHQALQAGKKPHVLIADNQKYIAKAIIIATGAETVWLGIPGEEKLLGRGVSSCAPCDAPFFKEKRVAVVGGGDAAMEEALVLAKYASEISLIHRRDQFRCSSIMEAKVRANPKIKILGSTIVTEILGDQKVEKLKLQSTKDNQTSELAVDGIFVAIGHMPSSQIFKGKLETDEQGFIKTANHSKTNIEGVFTAGDVHDMHYKQAVTAAGFGCMAALDVLKYLDNYAANN